MISKEIYVNKRSTIPLKCIYNPVNVNIIESIITELGKEGLINMTCSQYTNNIHAHISVKEYRVVHPTYGNAIITILHDFKNPSNNYVEIQWENDPNTLFKLVKEEFDPKLKPKNTIYVEHNPYSI